LLGAEREVLEIDEHGDRRLRVLSDVHAIRPLNARRDGPLHCIFVDAGAGPQGRTVVLGAARGPSYEPSSSTESTNEALLRAPRLLALSANHRARDGHRACARERRSRLEEDRDRAALRSQRLIDQETDVNEAPVKLLSSMATRAVLAELAAQFQEATGRAVEAEAAGGVDVAKRVRAGEAFDVVVLARDVIDLLISESVLLSGSRVDIVASPIAVAVRADAARPD